MFTRTCTQYTADTLQWTAWSTWRAANRNWPRQTSCSELRLGCSSSRWAVDTRAPNYSGWHWSTLTQTSPPECRLRLDWVHQQRALLRLRLVHLCSHVRLHPQRPVRLCQPPDRTRPGRGKWWAPCGRPASVSVARLAPGSGQQRCLSVRGPLPRGQHMVVVISRLCKISKILLYWLSRGVETCVSGENWHHCNIISIEAVFNLIHDSMFFSQTFNK